VHDPRAQIARPGSGAAGDGARGRLLRPASPRRLRQVFGLGGGPEALRLAYGRGFPAIRQCLAPLRAPRGLRSPTPLRVSPGLSPGSLLRSTPTSWGAHRRRPQDSRRRRAVKRRF